MQKAVAQLMGIVVGSPARHALNALVNWSPETSSNDLCDFILRALKYTRQNSDHRTE